MVKSSSQKTASSGLWDMLISDKIYLEIRNIFVQHVIECVFPGILSQYAPNSRRSQSYSPRIFPGSSRQVSDVLRSSNVVPQQPSQNVCIWILISIRLFWFYFNSKYFIFSTDIYISNDYHSFEFVLYSCIPVKSRFCPSKKNM